MIRRACFPISSTIEAQAGFLEKGQAGQMVVPVRYGLLEHEALGPVLIDTGYTPRLLTQKGWKMALYRMALDPQFHPHLLPQTMLNNWGYRLEDVRHVVVTHLHADHVCGLDLFPRATFHLSQACLNSWKARKRWSDVRHGLFRSLLPAAGERLKPMEAAVRQRSLGFGDSPGWDVLGDGSVWMVSLEGHMAGHAGVAFDCQERQVLYAADVAWTRHGYRQQRLPPAPLRWAIENTTQATAAGQAVLTAERLGWDVMLCHDPETTRWDCQP